LATPFLFAIFLSHPMMADSTSPTVLVTGLRIEINGRAQIPRGLFGVHGLDVDEATAAELQARARDVIEEQNRKALEHARELGVEDSLLSVEGLTPQMIEALAMDGVKTIEDFATCADWELAGGWTTVNGERVKDEGILEKFDMSLEEAQHLVMTARIQLGWVDPNELEAADAETEEEAEA
jgi:N utilization substance protein A